MPPIPGSPDHTHRAAQPPPSKPDHQFVAAILKALVMTFVTSVFFLFVGLFAVLLLLFLSAGALHRSARFRRGTHRRRRCRRGNSRSALRRLPKFRFHGGCAAADGDCVVCLDAFRDGQWCRELAACGHVFHRRCVDTWLAKVLACPICRRHVRLDDEDSSAEDWEDDEAKWWWSFDRSDGWGVM